ncbi:helix-turn-helix transcriptional regulator [Viridibacillus sp. YIM B01967]|uniref:Helix-turn-helix transcriptional regulator n=1 Tax=Viridibacillus soli TaxID=2798301 RepID=A0ABS1H2B1_9BACL|nr:helix-turn-helix transcriptional regulator [Viridibacillus soli]MBK3493317.1 helix-turn-helix transcriptional regulator [Viridibacillus soli]
MSPIELNKRQDEILEIVKGNGPITGEQIAERLSLTRATLRPDLAILTMAGFLDARPRVGYFYSGKKTGQAVIDSMMNMKVKDFQSIPVVVSENISVYDAICQMFLEDVGTLFVVDKNAYLTGVLSRKDLLRTSIGNQDLHNIPVHIIMTRMPNIAFCLKTDGLIQAANKLIERQIDALPVVIEHPDGYEVIGRLTKTNITRAFLSLADNHDL